MTVYILAVVCRRFGGMYYLQPQDRSVSCFFLFLSWLPSSLLVFCLFVKSFCCRKRPRFLLIPSFLTSQYEQCHVESSWLPFLCSWQMASDSFATLFRCAISQIDSLTVGINRNRKEEDKEKICKISSLSSGILQEDMNTMIMMTMLMIFRKLSSL